MLLRTLLAALLTITTAEFVAADQGKNRLANEASPYLRQHAGNPVDWYPWGKEAFEKARSENKPILLSVGYSTCHWCHVMERESYDDPAIAELLNRSFVAIKVDRERRPDIDEMYMLATELITQQGGWPNNVFLTPNLKPFMATTYQPRDPFAQMLKQIAFNWAVDQGALRNNADQLAGAIHRIMRRSVAAEAITPQVIDNAITVIAQRFTQPDDPGRKTPQFPLENLTLFLLDEAERTGDSRALQAATTRLDRIVRGGIRDHVGGGFHRYAIDSNWIIPHFEKMLYNQSLIGQVLAKGYRLTGNADYAETLRETMEFVLRDMQLPHGGFAAAFDADNRTEDGRKVEGEYYAWTEHDLGQALTEPEFKLIKSIYDITPDGNFEGANVLAMPTDLAGASARLSLPQVEIIARLRAVKSKLRLVRDQRHAPFRDVKALTGWNASMVRSLTAAARVLNEPRFLTAATRAGHFLWDKLYTGQGRLRRYYYEGRAYLPATQQDTALLALAFVALYDATSDGQWLARAETLAGEMEKLFRDEVNGDYFMTAKGDSFYRAKKRSDGDIAAGPALALELYAKLARRSLSSAYGRRGEAILAALSGVAVKQPSSNSHTLKAGDELLRGETGDLQYLAKGRVKISFNDHSADNPLAAKITIAKGWHINGHQPLNTDFIATNLELPCNAAGAAHKIVYPDALIKTLGFNDEALALYEGTIEIAAPHKISWRPGQKVKFTAQACSDEVCLIPETLSLTIPPPG